MSLPDNSLRRYARHVVLSEIGEAGQQKLLSSSALVVGAGGLGSVALAYLAAAGIGRLGIVEPDRVELSNLQRQVIFEEGDIGRAKAEAARDRIHEINSACEVELFPARLTADNAKSMVGSFDIVIDGSDNFETRFALSDACYDEKKTLVSAAISAFSGQLSTFKPYLGAPHPCYRCFIAEMPDRERSCAQEGVLGPLAGMMGSMQAVEAIKELLSIGTSLSGIIFRIDMLSGDIRKTALKRDPSCSFCNSRLVKKSAAANT